MENKIFTKTEKTPEVLFDYDNNVISIKGICVPEDPKNFFDKITLNLLNFKNNLQYDIYLEYFNTGTSKCLLNLLIESTKEIYDFKKLEVNWVIEEGDEELREAGEVFEEISKIKFNYKEIKVD